MFWKYAPKLQENTHAEVWFQYKVALLLRHGCSPVNLLHIFKTPLPKNTFWGLHLLIWLWFGLNLTLWSSIYNIYFIYGPLVTTKNFITDVFLRHFSKFSGKLFFKTPLDFYFWKKELTVVQWIPWLIYSSIVYDAYDAAPYVWAEKILAVISELKLLAFLSFSWFENNYMKANPANQFFA